MHLQLTERENKTGISV